METGPDGRIYVLEYGSGWFSKNPDAGLARLDYNLGNRAPEVKNIAVNKASGTLPLSVSFTVAARDPENNKLTYLWNLGNGVKKQTLVPKLAYTYIKKGNYTVSVEVKDEQNATAKSKTVSVLAGDYAPDLKVKLADLKANNAGKALMLSLDCKGCHKVNERSIGPAFTDVAKKYPKNNASLTHLSNKIIQGGNGVWGDVSMPAHPNLKPAETKQIINWIFSLKQ